MSWAAPFPTTKKLTLLFLSKAFLFNGQDYEKQKGPGTSDWSLRVTKQVQENSFIIDIFCDQVWWYDIKRFWVTPKIASVNLCKPAYDIINYSTFICPFDFGECEKERKKLQKLEYIEN